MNEYERLKETRVSGDELFSGKILHIYKDNVVLPNGNTVTRELIRHVGAVCVVAVNENNEIIMERQFRYPVDKVISEIPAGKLDSPSEDRLSAAKRELKEETGYTADNWVDLGIFYPAAAYSDEAISLYLATDIHPGERDLDDDEFLDVYLKPVSELKEEIMNGEIPDAKTQMGILKAIAYLGL